MSHLSPALLEIATKVLALQQLTKTTRMQTSRSQGALLAKLSPEDLAAVALYIHQAQEEGRDER